MCVWSWHLTLVLQSHLTHLALRQVSRNLRHTHRVMQVLVKDLAYVHIFHDKFSNYTMRTMRTLLRNRCYKCLISALVVIHCLIYESLFTVFGDGSTILQGWFQPLEIAWLFSCSDPQQFLDSYEHGGDVAPNRYESVSPFHCGYHSTGCSIPCPLCHWWVNFL